MRAIAWLLPWAHKPSTGAPTPSSQPPPPLSLPVFLSAPGDARSASRVPSLIGGSVVDAATAFSVKHAIGEDARDALVEAATRAKLRRARGAPSYHERARGLGFEKAGDAVAACWKEMDCQRAAPNASGLAVARTEAEALREASLIEGSMVVVATQSAPELSLNEVLAEHERVRHARGGDGAFVLAIPTCRETTTAPWPFHQAYRETDRRSFIGPGGPSRTYSTKSMTRTRPSHRLM